MTAASLIADLGLRGVEVILAGGKVRIEDREGCVRPEEMVFLRKRKGDVVALLGSPGLHWVCSYFTGDPRIDSHCRLCGGTFEDYWSNMGSHG